MINKLKTNIMFLYNYKQFLFLSGKLGGILLTDTIVIIFNLI